MPNRTHPAIRILFLADTHLGFDAPLRPRVPRRRRGEDFYRNYLTALRPAFDRQVDLVLHGGDMFFLSRVQAAVVQSAFAPLLQIADRGIPVFIVPGNHERSNIPHSLLETHPGIITFERPHTRVVTLRGCRIALTGFANIRHNAGLLFVQQLEHTGRHACEADIRLLCMHQAVEGAQVGAQNYTFRAAPDVIRGRNIPAGFHAVLSGHIHRHQVLTKDPAGRRLLAPAFYPGSTERTSFAEKEEEKGCILLTIRPGEDSSIHYRFVPLQTRPMIDLDVAARGLSLEQVRENLSRQIAALNENAIVRIRIQDGDAGSLIATLNDRWLRSVAPTTMNIGWAFPRRPVIRNSMAE